MSLTGCYMRGHLLYIIISLLMSGRDGNQTLGIPLSTSVHTFSLPIKHDLGLYRLALYQTALTSF